jgi:hypothetical protein
VVDEQYAAHAGRQLTKQRPQLAKAQLVAHHDVEARWLEVERQREGVGAQ